MPSRSGLEIQTEAVILRAVTFGENDLMVHFLTSQQGKLAGIAHHGRKSQKRFGTVLEPLNVVRLRFVDNGGIVSLREATLVDPPHHLDQNLNLLFGGFYLLDLVREWVLERHPEPKLYSVLRETLGRLSHEGPDSLSRVVQEFEFRLLALAGYRPNLTDCFACKKKWEPSERFFFVFKEGGLSCPSCLPRATPWEPFSQDHLPKILSRFIEYQLGHPLRSHKFLTNGDFLG